MTTDITELAQLRAELSNPAVGSKDHLRKLALSLVDALEKEQTARDEYEAGERSAAVKSVEMQDEIYRLNARIGELERQLNAAENNEIDARCHVAELESRTVTPAAADVLAERQRQVTAEGWSPKHDDQYKNTELAFAASCYAFHAAAASWDLEDDGIPYDSHPAPKQWPWDPSWWKPTDARRDLVKAGALILAEIERLDRAAGIKWEGE